MIHEQMLAPLTPDNPHWGMWLVLAGMLGGLGIGILMCVALLQAMAAEEGFFNRVIRRLPLPGLQVFARLRRLGVENRDMQRQLAELARWLPARGYHDQEIQLAIRHIQWLKACAFSDGKAAPEEQLLILRYILRSQTLPPAEKLCQIQILHEAPAEKTLFWFRHPHDDDAADAKIIQLYAELQSIAHADATLHPLEVKFLRRFAARFKIPAAADTTSAN